MDDTILDNDSSSNKKTGYDPNDPSSFLPSPSPRSSHGGSSSSGPAWPCCPRSPLGNGGLGREFRHVLDLAAPLIVSYAAVTAMSTTDLAFVGKLGAMDLAAMNLAYAIMLGTFIVPIALGAAVRVLGAQAYGADRPKQVGLWVQTGIAWTMILCFIPITAVWWFTGDLVCAMGLQDEELEFVHEEQGGLPSAPPPPPPDEVSSGSDLGVVLCERSSQYARMSLLWLWIAVIYNILVSGMESVELVVPVMVISVVFVPINIGLNYLFIVTFEWGIAGSALATFASKVLQMLVLIIVARYWCRVQDKFWDGWTAECFHWHRARAFLKLGAPMALTEVLYDWTFEIAMLITVSFKSIAIAAATGVLINVIFFFTPLLTGIYIAVSVRVATLLGEYDVEGTKRTIWVAVISGVIVATLGATFMVALQEHIPKVYTDDKEVLEIISDYIPLAAADFVLSSFTYVVQGILEGSARPHLATASAICGTWLIGLPISLLLALKMEMELTGIFIGLIIGEACKLTFMILTVVFTNWQRQCERAIQAAEEEERLLNEAAGLLVPNA